MKNHILTTKFFYKSASLLRDHLQELSGKRILLTYNPEKVENFVARYGTSASVPNKTTEYNSIETIRMISDKRKFSEVARNADILAPICNTRVPKEP